LLDTSAILKRCHAFNEKFKLKLNKVVNRLNFGEDMVSSIEKLQLFRWKVFRF
jgi:hypothetical protein